MPSPRPQRPQNCRTDAKRPAAYTAPTKGLRDAKPPALPTPEENRSHEDAEHAPEEACSESCKLTHRSKDVEEAAFSNHDDCNGSRERTEDHKGKDPGEHEHTDNDLGARDTPGGGQVPAMTQQPAPPPYACTRPSICIPPRAPGGLPSRTPSTPSCARLLRGIIIKLPRQLELRKICIRVEFQR